MKAFPGSCTHYSGSRVNKTIQGRCARQRNTFDFDGSGNVTSCSNHNVSISCRYDHLGRKLGETVDYGNFKLTMAWSYHPDGTTRSFTYPHGRTKEYLYPGSGRIIETAGGCGRIEYCDFRGHRPARVILPNGTITRFSYDCLQRINSIRATGPDGKVIQEISYEYDRYGNISRRGTVGGEFTYAYDSYSRLVGVCRDGQLTEAYSYDDAGNRLASNIANGWAYGGSNELLAHGNNEFEYDESGNTARINRNGLIRNYIYDSENRLTRINYSENRPLVKYAYDPFGRRIKKEVFGNAVPAGDSRKGMEVYFLYSDEGLIGEYDAQGNEVRAYGYRPQSHWTTDPVYMVQNGRRFYFLNDHLGTPQIIIDESGKVAWSAQYEAYGQALVAPGSSVTNNLRFPGGSTSMRSPACITITIAITTRGRAGT